MLIEEIVWAAWKFWSFEEKTQVFIILTGIGKYVKKISKLELSKF